MKKSLADTEMTIKLRLTWEKVLSVFHFLGIVLNRHRADGLGVWAISGDDMLEALKHIEEGAIPPETSGEVQTFIKEVLESSMKE
ncbi:unnamed protein product [Sphagnum jensenii]|uniref:Uncharacterized protein n=1 Tax=Sphagnum jensenii TaxID=128206 RepID=A0ABP0X3L6_9BRYO